MSTIMQDSMAAETATRNSDDVLALTDQEWWHEYDRFAYLEEGRYHLSGIKESAGIGSRDTQVNIEQVKALHSALGRIVDGLDKPASAGPVLRDFIDMVPTNHPDLAADAGVDADALQRHFDGEGPLSQIAYRRVLRALTGKAVTA